MAHKPGKRSKHVPQRTCVGCHTVMPKRELIRIVRGLAGVQIDTTGKKPGRGAYLHDRRACWERGLRGALAHALKVELSAEDRAHLEEFMRALPQESEEAPMSE